MDMEVSFTPGLEGLGARLLAQKREASQRKGTLSGRPTLGDKSKTSLTLAPQPSASSLMLYLSPIASLSNPPPSPMFSLFTSPFLRSSAYLASHLPTTAVVGHHKASWHC